MSSPQERREQLFTRVNTDIAANLANADTLSKCIFRLKKNRSPGVDGLSVEHLISIFYTGNGPKFLKDQIVREYVILLQKFLTGNLSPYQTEVFYSLKLLVSLKNLYSTSKNSSAYFDILIAELR